MGSPEPRAIPPGVSHLAGEVLHSASELEVALLARTLPDRVWTPAAVRESLRMSYAQAHDTLARLAAIGVVEGTGSGGYRYAPSPELSEALDALATLYRSHRQAVLRLVFSRSKGQVSYFPPVGQRRPREDG